MTIDDSVNEFLNSSSVPTAKFPTIGTVHKGTVVAATKRQQRDMDTNQPKVWDNGDPMWEIVIDVATDERDRDIADDNGHRRLYVSGNMLKATREALRQAKASLEVGGILAVQYTGDGEATKRGFNPPKIYAAAYKAPALDLDDESFGSPVASVPPPAESLI